MNPLKYLFEKPALSNRTAKWLMMLSEFEIAYVVPKTVKGQTIAEHPLLSMKKIGRPSFKTSQ